MSAAIETGGPAFPTENAHQSGYTTWHSEGMTLRDYFAAKALASGEASNFRDNHYTPESGLTIIENTALCAYQFADAMLKARKVQP